MALPVVLQSSGLAGARLSTPIYRLPRRGPSLLLIKPKHLLLRRPSSSSCLLGFPIRSRASGRTVVVVAQLEERQFESVGAASGAQEPVPLVVESFSSRELEVKNSGGEEISLEGGSGTGGIEGGFGGGGDGGNNNDNNDKDNSGEGENQENNKKMSMSQKLTLGYAALVGAGGVAGFLKRGSKTSLAAGGVSALLLFYVYTQLPTNPVFASSVGLGVSAALLGVMGSRFKKSGKMFPAGVVSIVSFIMTGGYIHGILRSMHA
ncbi:protein FATTY ACID EXPORT 2, chloroplastic-like [Nymphaea colorata]|nr:protein FATTY ACID EXPORT 2, chloroplastic-like [Nymphaea colorata]